MQPYAMSVAVYLSCFPVWAQVRTANGLSFADLYSRPLADLPSDNAVVRKPRIGLGDLGEVRSCPPPSAKVARARTTPQRCVRACQQACTRAFPRVRVLAAQHLCMPWARTEPLNSTAAVQGGARKAFSAALLPGKTGQLYQSVSHQQRTIAAYCPSPRERAYTMGTPAVVGSRYEGHLKY
jgi:hypothetical protein